MDALCVACLLLAVVLALARVPWRRLDRRPVVGTTGRVTVGEWRGRLAALRASRGRAG